VAKWPDKTEARIACDIEVRNSKSLHDVCKGALVSKKLTRVGIGHDPRIVLEDVLTYGVVNDIPSDKKDGKYVISFDGGIVMDLKRLAFRLVTNTPKRCTKDRAKQSTNKIQKAEPKRDHELEHREIMYQAALHAAGVVDSDDSSIEITEVIPGKKKINNDFDDEITITRVKKVEIKKEKNTKQSKKR
jgi:hypothetical protein